MIEEKRLRDRWEDFRRSGWFAFWSSAVSCAIVISLGFSVLGWKTGPEVRAMTKRSALEAQQELLSALCVSRFVSSTDAATNLRDLKEAASWARLEIIDQGGYADIALYDGEGNIGISDCAERLADMKQIPPRVVKGFALEGRDG